MKKFSDFINESEKGTLYSDDNPRDTIKGIRYVNAEEAEKSVDKLESLYNSGKIDHQRNVATANTMHQRAKLHANPTPGIKAAEKVWKDYLERLKKRTQDLKKP